MGGEPEGRREAKKRTALSPQKKKEFAISVKKREKRKSAPAYPKKKRLSVSLLPVNRIGTCGKNCKNIKGRSSFLPKL